MKKLAAISMLFFSVKLSVAQQMHPKNKQEIIGVCGKVMEAFKIGKFSAAYDLLRSYSVIEKYKLDTLVIVTNDQMKSLGSSYGSIMSYEEVSERDVKSSLVQLIYLLKFQHSFLKFSFILYNNGSSWTITSFTYDTEVGDLFTYSEKQP